MTKTELYLLRPEKYFDGVLRILKNKIKSRKIIYVTTNKPFNHLVNIFKEHKIPYNKIFFVDCISKHIGENLEREQENCLCVESPQSLTEIGVAISQSVKYISGEKTVFLDSLSTLLVYNDSATVGRFSNFIINKMRNLGVDTVILALESDVNKDVIKVIVSFADKVVKYGG